MRITHVTLSEFRRFAAKTTVRLDGRVIAIVGPNEAGKTTLLEALESLDGDHPLSDDDPTRDVDDADPEVAATFELDDYDRDALAEIPGGSEIVRFTLSKDPAGELIADLDPRPRQVLDIRKQLSRGVKEVLNHPILEQAERAKNLKYQRSLLSRISKWASSEADPLPSAFFSEARQALTAVRQALDNVKDYPEAAESLEGFHDWLGELLDYESDFAAKRCADVLIDRRPRFLMFREHQRDLRPHYRLSELGDDPPAPIANLAQLAGLDLAELVEKVDSGRMPRAVRLCEIATEKLAEVFSDSWVRTDVAPVLYTDGEDLHVYVRTPGGEDLSRFDERSDGFRWFVALVAFVGGQESSGSKPILLVDEAETHLSYDAQANLSATLAEQDLAQLVLYTTHSAGCLPPDLGAGIRAVVPQADGERSTIANGFWHHGPGYTPLLLAMGANALAFTPARRVIVGEGASESILLPSLLREASDRERLDFQIAPGLSNVTQSAMRDVLSMAGEVGYLVDGDEAGDRLKDHLVAMGFPEERIVSYRDAGTLRVTLEDLVHPSTFVKAVNLEIERWQGGEAAIAKDDVPSTSRMAWLNGWCADNGIQPLSKPALSQRIVDLRTAEPLVDPKHRKRLNKLVERLEAVLAF